MGKIIHYSDAKSLGFIRRDIDDRVFFNKNGYSYFTTTLDVGGYLFDWDSETKFVTFFKNEKREYVIESLEELVEKIEWCKITTVSGRILELEKELSELKSKLVFMNQQVPKKHFNPMQ